MCGIYIDERVKEGKWLLQDNSFNVRGELKKSKKKRKEGHVNIYSKHDRCNFYLIFFFFYLLKLLVFLYFFWFDLIFIYIYLFICALKEWEDFRLIYKGFTCKVGLDQLNQVNLPLVRHEFKRRPTQLNLSLTRARNQRKFAPNPSPIWIRIPACHQLVFLA